MPKNLNTFFRILKGELSDVNVPSLKGSILSLLSSAALDEGKLLLYCELAVTAYSVWAPLNL